MNLFDPSVAPFSIALAILGLLVVVEGVGMVFGASLAGMSDDVGVGDGGAEGADVSGASGLLSWLGVGRVPLMVVLGAFLLSFSALGFAAQGMIQAVTGGFAPAWLAGPLALAASLPPTRWISRGISRILPREETDAISSETFIGRIAIVTRGEARQGLPAEAKLQDAKGAARYVLVEPDEGGIAFPAGSEVLLVQRNGAVFRAILNPSAALSVSAG